MNELIIITATVSEHEIADRISAALIEARLAVAVQTREVSSRYRWKGKVHDTQDYILNIHTTIDRLDPVAERIAREHPQGPPLIHAVPAIAGVSAYVRWIRAAGTAI